MNERWVMNRLGFVNFWLYDVEDFPLENGRLLLRGQNGSGKSITTQSFIPFILDGDRTPSRLDPFGSSDRKMEYYFLGEEGKEESTGYLFLEFRKKTGEEYRTIAIGQRARRGKPMDFWGLVVLDGRRIGYDFELFDEVGSNRIPLGKNEMKKRLGEHNIFTDSQTEYKKMVNKYLFGFPREEQYEQFIRLLVKVRAPKLSKEFKPTKVYEILNDSLQTLTDEDLRPMVDAMEKMDSIQANLEQLNRAIGDVKIIRNEYMRYNQFVLGRKARSYLEAKNQARDAQEKFDKNKIDLEEYCAQQEKKVEQRQAAEDRLGLIQTEMQTILDTSNLEEIDAKLDAVKRAFENDEQQKKTLVERIEQNRAEIRSMEHTLKQLENDIEYCQVKLNDGMQVLEDLQETMQWSGHKTVLAYIRDRNTTQIQTIQMEIRQLQDKLKQGKASIEQCEQAQIMLDDATEKTDRGKTQYEEAEAAFSYQEKTVEDTRERLIRELYQKNQEHKIWTMDEQALKTAEEYLIEYQMGDGRKLDQLFFMSYSSIERSLERDKETISCSIQEKIQQRNALQLQWEEIQAQQELRPHHEEAVDISRRKMEELGIAAIPFYKTIEFSDVISEEQCAMLECQLERMGLLDALVVSDEDFKRIQLQYPNWIDCVIYPQNVGTSDFTALKVNTELDDDIQRAVSKILSHFSMSEEKQSAQISLNFDGEFRHGLLWGRTGTKDEAEYVGTLARRRRKEKFLAELKENIESLNTLIAEQEGRVSALQNRLDLITVEYADAVEITDLEESLQRQREKQLLRDTKRDLYYSLEEERKKLEAQYKQSYAEMVDQCKALPYDRTSSAFAIVLEETEEYRNALMTLGNKLREMDNKEVQKSNEEHYVERVEDTIDGLYSDLRQVENRLKENQIQVRHYEEILNDPEIQQQAEKLEQLKQEKKALESKQTILAEELGGLKTKIFDLQSSETARRTDLLKKVERQNVLRRYFEEELQLKLVFDPESQSIESCAQKAVSMIRKGDENREASSVFQSLHEVFRGHSGNLVSYSTSMEECFEDSEIGGDALRKRYRISSAWNGKKVYFEEFFQILKATIEETELLIRQRDRELFEDILSKTISQQLTDRIAESRKWVSDMSGLMKLDTSMGLYFSLDWKPLAAESEQELDISDLEKILSRDRELLTDEDIEKVAEHFRSKIRAEKLSIEDEGLPVNYMDLVRDALDYRKWFAFKMYYYRGEENRKPLTNAAFNKFSGGEKAMAMYAPLFAAVNAQYKKAMKADHPRVIALDEAFAGVDDKNISSMFQLVSSMDFDYIMNSQALWGCYAVVDALHIAELRRPMNSQVVSVIHYTWNGHERMLDEQ